MLTVFQVFGVVLDEVKNVSLTYLIDDVKGFKKFAGKRGWSPELVCLTMVKVREIRKLREEIYKDENFINGILISDLENDIISIYGSESESGNDTISICGSESESENDIIIICGSESESDE